MATFTEDFEALSTGTLGGQGSWVETGAGSTGPIQVYDSAGNKKYKGNTAGYNTAYYNSAVGSDDQYAQAALTLPASDDSVRIGVLVRCSADTGANRDFYFAGYRRRFGTYGRSYITRVNNNTETILLTYDHTAGNVFTDGDVFRLEVEGAELRTYKNGTLISTYDDSAAPLSTGFVGVATYAGSTTSLGDTWEGGALAGASGAAPSASQRDPSGLSRVITLNGLGQVIY